MHAPMLFPYGPNEPSNLIHIPCPITIPISYMDHKPLKDLVLKLPVAPWCCQALPAPSAFGLRRGCGLVERHGCTLGAASVVDLPWAPAGSGGSIGVRLPLPWESKTILQTAFSHLYMEPEWSSRGYVLCLVSLELLGLGRRLRNKDVVAF